MAGDGRRAIHRRLIGPHRVVGALGAVVKAEVAGLALPRAARGARALGRATPVSALSRGKVPDTFAEAFLDAASLSVGRHFSYGSENDAVEGYAIHLAILKSSDAAALDGYDTAYQQEKGVIWATKVDILDGHTLG